MLKLASTETALKVDLDYNREMKVGGLASLLNALLVGAPAYGQTKFNVLNYGFTHQTDNPLAACVCGAFCGILFFVGEPVIKCVREGRAGGMLTVAARCSRRGSAARPRSYLPRFLLAGLLIFSGAGFLERPGR